MTHQRPIVMHNRELPTENRMSRGYDDWILNRLMLLHFTLNLARLLPS
jgi:hypothetical protein